MNRLDTAPTFRKLTGWIGVAALISAASILPACSNEATDTTAENAQENVTAGEITDGVGQYEGEVVTVREEVEEVIGDYAFLLDEDRLFGGEELLVINASETGLELPTDDDVEVQVTGEVRQLVIADLEAEYGIDLDPDLFVEYENQPVIIAQSAALAPDPNELTENPEQYYGQRIAVVGEIESFYTEDTFLLDEDSLFGEEDLLVLVPGASVSASEDEPIALTGTLQPFVVADIDQDYDLTWDLDLQQELEAEFSDRPVFIADGTYPSAM